MRIPRKKKKQMKLVRMRSEKIVNKLFLPLIGATDWTKEAQRLTDLVAKAAGIPAEFLKPVADLRTYEKNDNRS